MRCWLRRVADHRGQRRDRVAEVERRRTFHSALQRRAQTPDVHGAGCGASASHLRRDIRRGADHQAGAGQGRILCAAGDSEVGKLHPTVGGDQDIARFDIAMRDADLVRRVQRGEHGQPDSGGFGGLQDAVVLDDLGQVLRRHELHHDPWAPVVLDHVVKRHDVRMGQRRDRTGLAKGALARNVVLFVGLGRRQQDLFDRDRAAQYHVERLPHCAHRAAAEQ